MEQASILFVANQVIENTIIYKSFIKKTNPDRITTQPREMKPWNKRFGGVNLDFNTQMMATNNTWYLTIFDFQ